MSRETQAHIVYILSGTALASATVYAAVTGEALGAAMSAGALYFVTQIAAAIRNRGKV